jgi:hypothetical protein
MKHPFAQSAAQYTSAGLAGPATGPRGRAPANREARSLDASHLRGVTLQGVCQGPPIPLAGRRFASQHASVPRTGDTTSLGDRPSAWPVRC